ncbi:uncharacterized protein [Watersipora subatra]|uniref:uncharacterized protein n=1 Tax=Watersipora subatra TaxID=2589382 RepID=UPI00355B9C1A
MLSKTPVRENKRTVRRKLASGKDTKNKSTFPISKKAKVANEEQDSTNETQGSSPKPDFEELLSQEVCGFLSNGLPRVSWQPQMITSPLQVDARSRDYGGIIANATMDVRESEPVSTNYLAGIWKNQQARRGQLMQNDCTPDNKNKPDWLDKMFTMVSELEDNNSSSPISELCTTPITRSSSTHPYTAIVQKPAVLASPDDKCEKGSHPSSAFKPGSSRSSSQNYIKLEANSSLFSDSLDGFTTDFTLSDTEPDEENAPFSGNTKCPANVINTGNSQGSQVSLSKAQVVSSDKKPSSADINLPSLLPVIKQEAKTPPNVPATMKMRRRGSPGTPLRRYSSHDSAMRSPLPSRDKAPANSSQPELPVKFSDLIEEKRKLALSRLKSRKGSLIRHKSLDNAAMASQSVQSATSQSTIGPEKTLEQLIEEKRRLAAEKLQKHREENCDRSTGMSGSLRQRRISGNHDKTSVSAEFATQVDRLSCGSSLSNKENKSALGKPVLVKEELSSQASFGSQGSAFSGKIVLDTLIEDLEQNSPRKAKQASDTAISCGSAIPQLSGNKTGTGLNHQTQQSADNMQIIDEKTLLAIERKRQTALEKRKLLKLQTGS